MRDSAKSIAQLSPEQRRLLQLKLAGLDPKRDPTAGISRRKDFSPAVTSYNQEWLWSIDQVTGGNPSWNVFTGSALNGRLDIQVLERSLNEIVRRHEVLRTTFQANGGHVVQVIAPSLEIELPVVDLRAVPREERAVTAKHLTTQCYRQLFNLASGPLVRPTLFRLADEEYQLFVAMHHTVTDWVSFSLLNKELAAIYQATEAGQPAPLPALPIQYADYAVWERKWVRSEAAQAQLDYWRRQLEGAPEFTDLPLDWPRPPIQTYRGARQHMEFPFDVTQALRLLTQQEGSTLFITLLAALKVLLHFYTRQEDIVVGTPIVGRKLPETQKLIGLFLNHLALRCDLSGDPSFRQFLNRVRRTVLSGYANQDFPFGALVQELKPARDLSRMPFFQVMYFFLTVPPAESFSDIHLGDYEAFGETARYDLLVSVWDKAQTVKGVIEYNVDLFAASTVAHMARNFELLAERIAAAPDSCISGLLDGLA